MSRLVYVVLTAKSWSGIGVHGVVPLDAAPALGTRFLPVFDSMEEARKHYPEAGITVARIPEAQEEERD